MNKQFNIFDYLQEDVKITKPIRLIEFFAGYGSQNLALKYLGANYESWKICEWATKSIQAYKDLHHSNDDFDYSAKLSYDEIKEKLFSLGISADYNKPMTYDQIKRKGESWCRNVYNNIIATNNLVNIQQVKGEDLNIIDTDKYDYVLTYSFPCQDLSLAGKRAGMEKGSGTRSGMLWEVERILKECEKLPHILLMENVTQIHSKKNKDNFNLWIKALNELGYASFWKDMNSKNYGIPQNRDRTFMISILKSYNSGKYEFPQGFKLELTLADMLEDEVDEKYYLSDKMIKYISERGTGGFANADCRINLEVARPITTDPNKRAGTTNYLCNDLPLGFDLNNLCIKIPEATKKGYAEAYEGDGVYINRPHQKRGCVQKGLIQTLKTSPDDVGVVVRVGNYSPSGHNASSIVDVQGIAPTVMENHGTVTAIVEEKNLKQKMCNELIQSGKVKEYDVIRHSYSTSRMNGEMKDIQQNNMSPTLDTRCDCLGVAVKNKELRICSNCKHFTYDTFCGFNHPMCYKHGSLYEKPEMANNCDDYIYQKPIIYNECLRIRKLTPKECGRLMGVHDSDIDKMSKNQSDSSLYHLFGDSIVVDVLMNIFKNLFV